MMNLEMPTTAILLKKPRRLREDRFVVTYEYGWSGFTDADDSKEHESTKVTATDLRILVRCSWTDVTIRFPE